MKALRMLVVFVCSLLFVSDVSAQFRRSRRQVYNPPIYQQTQLSIVASPEPYKGDLQECKDALDEVNAARAKRGLKPFIRDEGLTKAAYKAAGIRAANLIDGHLNSDFDCLPSGSTALAAGCGALTTDWGWGSCCTYDSYTYAGASWVMGRNNKRYMHLFVR